MPVVAPLLPPLTKAPHPYHLYLCSPFPKVFPPFWTKMEWRVHNTSILHTFISTSEARSDLLKLPFLTLPRKIRKISKCLKRGRLSSYMKVQRTCWHPRGETWRMPSLILPAKEVLPSTVLCRVQGSDGHCYITPSSQDHILDSFIFPARLPCTQVFYQYLLTKGGKLWFHFLVLLQFLCENCRTHLVYTCLKEKHRTVFNW